ncbi:MAG: hypothetical protein JNM07_14825 [Phycisphaerae bacterium]|nr:hypothetical protein [Phycisphaerae bacterium]
MSRSTGFYAAALLAPLAISLSIFALWPAPLPGDAVIDALPGPSAPVSRVEALVSPPDCDDAPAVAEPAPAFDPFAFSAVVVMSRQGRDGLLSRLAEIADIAHLRQLADAQHLAFDRSLTDVDALREAIVKGAEQRIADRRAAAS